MIRETCGVTVSASTLTAASAKQVQAASRTEGLFVLACMV